MYHKVYFVTYKLTDHVAQNYFSYARNKTLNLNLTKYALQ